MKTTSLIGVNFVSAETPVEFLIPFAGTAVGSASVYFMKNGLNRSLSRGMEGFAAGVMTAASVWSLLISSMERSAAWGHRAFVPAAVVFWLGVFFLLALDHAVPHLHMFSEKPEGGRRELARTTMLALAVALHNVPEGMAVGTVYAAFASSGRSSGAAPALSVGTAVQNLPEGAIVSMPLRSRGVSSHRAGILSGAVEPLGALLTFWAVGAVVPLLPYFPAFAAGAMVYVVVEELIPEMSSGEHSHVGVLSYMLGFSVMMVLDVLFG